MPVLRSARLSHVWANHSEAHKAFDPLWKDGAVRRSDAYKWLAGQMGIEFKHCHIGGFDVAQCDEAIRFCSERDHTADVTKMPIST